MKIISNYLESLNILGSTQLQYNKTLFQKTISKTIFTLMLEIEKDISMYKYEYEISILSKIAEEN